MKNFKFILTILILMCSVFFTTAHSAPIFQAQIAYDGQTHNYKGTYFNVRVNNQNIKSPIPPIVLENGRSIVAVREIFESVGAEVLWTHGSPDRVLICHDSDIVSLALDDDIALVNGKNVKMEVPAKLVAYNGIGKTMVPVRFVAQMLGMEVDYDEVSGNILINNPKPTPTPTPKPTPTPTPLDNVDAISFAEGKDKVVVQIALDEAVKKYNTFELENPDRVVLDLYGFDISGVSSSYDVDTFVSTIRTGMFNGNARIVFDVEDLKSYKTTLSKDKKMLTVTLYKKGSLADSSFKVVIDPGHGGSDPGAIGYNKDGTEALYEKDVTLPISKMVYDILEENGIDVYYTRNTDVYVTLDERTSFANEIDASLFVSIHCNAFESDDVNGTLVMHHTSNDTDEYGLSGKDLANNILKYLPKALGTKDNGRTDGSAMYVIRKTKMPSVIVETAFITNESDRKILSNKTCQKKAAEAIAKGIMDSVEMLKK